MNYDDFIYDIESNLDPQGASDDLVPFALNILREQIADAMDYLSDVYDLDEAPSVDEIVDEVQSEWFKDLNL